MAKQNLIVDKSFGYALSIIELNQFLVNEKKEYVLSKQVLRSGTSVGANVCEASVSQSKKEFIAKKNISLKEIHEPSIGFNCFSRLTTSMKLKHC